MPAANAARICGNPTSASATRTFSRAAPRSMPHCQFNQWAHEAMPPCAQPRRRSNSAIKASQRASAAAIRAARVVMAAARSLVSKLASVGLEVVFGMGGTSCEYCNYRQYFRLWQISRACTLHAFSHAIRAANRHVCHGRACRRRAARHAAACYSAAGMRLAPDLTRVRRR